MIQTIQNTSTSIGVKTIAVYSRIAQLGRNPNKRAEQKLLIQYLQGSLIKTTVNGSIKLKDPQFVVMSKEDFEKCFGNPARIHPSHIIELT